MLSRAREEKKSNSDYIATKWIDGKKKVVFEVESVWLALHPRSEKHDDDPSQSESSSRTCLGTSYALLMKELLYGNVLSHLKYRELGRSPTLPTWGTNEMDSISQLSGCKKIIASGTGKIRKYKSLLKCPEHRSFI